MIRQERHAEAEAFALEARDIYGDVTPEGHFLRAFPLLTVAESRLLRGDGAGAELAMRAALPVLQAALPGHFATAIAECRLGAALALQGRLAQTAPLVTDALDALRAGDQTPARYVEECAAAAAALAR